MPFYQAWPTRLTRPRRPAQRAALRRVAKPNYQRTRDRATTLFVLTIHNYSQEQSIHGRSFAPGFVVRPSARNCFSGANLRSAALSAWSDTLRSKTKAASRPQCYRWGVFARICPKRNDSRFLDPFYTMHGGSRFRLWTGVARLRWGKTAEKTSVSTPRGLTHVYNGRRARNRRQSALVGKCVSLGASPGRCLSMAREFGNSGSSLYHLLPRKLFRLGAGGRIRVADVCDCKVLA